MTIGFEPYFRRRMLQEEEAARRASCVEARICHLKLAKAYRELTFDPSAGAQAPSFVPSDCRRPLIVAGEAPARGVTWSIELWREK